MKRNRMIKKSGIPVSGQSAMRGRLARRFGAGTMATVLTMGYAAAPVQAAAPLPSVDESVYVTMDYYGKTEEVSIVKGCTLNGNTAVVDYGNYDKVTNMSNSAVPVLEDGKVIWELEEGMNTFYFQGDTNELATELPWTLDVSYKLNGVPHRAEDLAGANGMVTINITAVPNEKAPEYYRNNLVLITGTMVDMEDTLSIEAPGAQLQSLGTKKAVVFAAMPGETGNFQMNIGTESFETIGLIFMMAPATLESLDMISDIREVKDKVKDSMDAMSDGADIVLNNIADMKKNLEQAKSGLNFAKEAKGIYDAGRNEVKTDADLTIDSLTGIMDTLNILSMQTETAKEDINEATAKLDAITEDIAQIHDIISEMNEVSDDMQDSLNDMRRVVTDALGKNDVKELKSLLKSASETNVGMAMAGRVELHSDDALAYGLQELLGNYIHVLDKVKTNPTIDLLDESHDLIGTAQDLSHRLTSILDATVDLEGDFSEDYKNEILNFMSDMQAFIFATNTTIVGTQNTLKAMRSLMDATESSLDKAVDSSLNGMIGLMDNGIGLTDGTETIRNAKDTVKSAIDDEIDELEADTNLLNIDTGLEFPSFTSDKNHSPSSIQIVMRTAEITVPDDVDNTMELEKAKEDIGLWDRIKAVFEKMFGWISI